MTFESLERQFRPMVYARALKCSGNRDDAGDITQEVFVKAYRAIESLKSLDNPAAYLMVMTRNVWIEFIRKDARRNMALFAINEEVDGDDLIDESSCIEKSVFTKLRAQLIVDSLPLREKQIAVGMAFGFSYAEIAQLAGIPEGTVKSALHRIRYGS